jgi:type IV secretory pathway TraG/TraD family ATPase VirD4
MNKTIKASSTNIERNAASVKVYSLPFVLLFSISTFLMVGIVVSYWLNVEFFQFFTIPQFNELTVNTFLNYLGFDYGYVWDVWLSKQSSEIQLLFIKVQVSILIFDLFISFFAGRWAYIKTNISAERQIGGSKLYSQNEAEKKLKKIFSEDLSASGKGLPINETVSLPKNRETQNILVIGQIGSGKTVVQLPMIKKAIREKSKSFIFDIKGDFTSYFRNVEHVKIMAPWDKDSVKWDLAKDVYDEFSALKFATALIPETQDKMWSQAGRTILSGMCLSLIKQHGKSWGWKSLSEMLKLPEKQLHHTLLFTSPEAALLVDPSSKTSKSMLLTLQSFTLAIHHLAIAWGNAEDGISLCDWVVNEKETDCSTLILQQNPNYEALSEALANLCLEFISKQILSLPDSRTRRFYFFLDEFAKLNFSTTDFMITGRSKGVVLTLGIQDLALLSKKMSHEEIMALASMIGSLIILRVGLLGETLTTLSAALGEKEVERLNTNFDNNGAISHSWQRITLPVVSKSDLANLKQVTFENGVEGYFSAAGTGIVAKLRWELKPETKVASSIIPADWTLQDNLNINDESDAETSLDHAFASEEVKNADD